MTRRRTLVPLLALATVASAAVGGRALARRPVPAPPPPPAGGDDVLLVDLSGRLRRRERVLLRRFYEEVLVPSFPPDELQTLDDLVTGLRADGPATVISVAVDASGAPLGGLVLDWDAEVRVLLAAYLAVHPRLRGHGIGSRLEAALGRRCVASYRPLLFLGEAQDPRRHDVVDGVDPEARLRLFDRLGLRLLATPYLTPRLHDDLPRPEGMLLLAYHVDPEVVVSDGGGDAVPAPLLAAFVRRSLTSCEGPDVLTDDPEVVALLRHLDARDVVPLLPATAWTHVPELTRPH